MNLILRVLPSILILVIFTVKSVNSAELAHGIVSMLGSITDSPCAIDVRDRYQLITIPALTVNDFILNGGSQEVPFQIRLVNCNPQENNRGWDYFNITFDGESSDDVLFNVSGDAHGVGLKIFDSQGNAAMPGSHMKPRPLLSGDNVMDFSIKLVSNYSKLSSGHYNASIRFKIDYF